MFIEREVKAFTRGRPGESGGAAEKEGKSETCHRTSRTHFLAVDVNCFTGDAAGGKAGEWGWMEASQYHFFPGHFSVEFRSFLGPLFEIDD